MGHDPLRCPFCAGIVEAVGSWWGKIWPFAAPTAFCRSCRRMVPARDARNMGQAMGYWVREFQQHLAEAVHKLPALTINQALRAILPGLDLEETRRVAGLESLGHFAAQVYRPVLQDRAQGRHADLHVVLLEEQGQPMAVGLLGRTSAESGEKESEVFLARVARDQFIAYIPARPPTPRLREALRAQERKVRESAAGAKAAKTAGH